MAVTGEASNITRNTYDDMDVEPDALNTMTIFLCVITNTIVLFVVRRQKDLQEVMRVLYQILSVANAVLGISWSLWNMILTNAGGDQTMCIIISMTFPFFYHTSLLIKTCCLCGISINLYVPCHESSTILHDCNTNPVLHRSRSQCYRDYAGLWSISAHPRFALHKSYRAPLYFP